MKLSSRAARTYSKTAVRFFSVQRSCLRSKTPPSIKYTPIGPSSGVLRSNLDQERPSPWRSHKNFSLFKDLVLSRWQLVRRNMGDWSADNTIYQSFGIHSAVALNRESKQFLEALTLALNNAANKSLTGRNNNPLYWNLRNAFIRGDAKELDLELRYSFQSFALRSKFSQSVTASHMKLADLRNPFEWFPATRMMQRTIHLHVGPTNSGKTYNALKALENAKTGIYAGPLRLLAHEVYTRFKAKGLPCALVTGEEQRIPEGVGEFFSSCTVEMTPLNQRVDVAVIDEIQMIGDSERGWAWTQALLGVQAKEVHLCGEERTVQLIQKLCAVMGDECIVHRYQRLSPLKTMTKSLDGDFGKLERGDCVVSFSRLGIHKTKAAIEQVTGRRCAVVYGSLPPETRAQQAALFNDPDNDFDYLAASDAIGMGLNLEIKRVIFETAAKFDGNSHRLLGIPEVKQIGGRAGRFRTARQEIQAAPETSPTEAAPAPSVGLVTTLDYEDLHHIEDAFNREAPPLRTAGLFPPVSVMERFVAYFPPTTPFSFTLSRLRELAKVSDLFHLCDLAVPLSIADVLQDIPMSIYDRCTFLTIPVSFRDYKQKEVVRSLARSVSTMKGGHLLEIEDLDLEILDGAKPGMTGAEYLMALEALHKAVTMYLWLSYRYRGVFASQGLAFHVKSLVEDKITTYLDNLNFSKDLGKSRREQMRKIAEKHEREIELLGDEAQASGEPHHEGPGQWNEEGHEEPLFEDDAVPPKEELEQNPDVASNVMPHTNGQLEEGRGRAASQSM